MRNPRLVDEVAKLLRDWEAGAVPAAAPLSAVRTLDAALVAGVGQPVAEVLGRILPPAARGLLVDPVLARHAADAGAIAAQLHGIGVRLQSAGLVAVALKGAAFVAKGGCRALPWRGMIDLDLLVAQRDLHRAVATLQAAGYRSDDAAYVPTDYHWPALRPPTSGRSVELHVALGWRHTRPLDGLAERARPSPSPGLAVPSPDDRLAHLVHHAQIADGGWSAGVARLRDALDWLVLTRRAGADPKAVRERFAAAGLEAPFDAFAALAAVLWGDDRAPSPDATRWAEAARETLLDPAEAERRRRRTRARRALGDIANPRLMAHVVAGMLNPTRLRRFARSMLRTR